MIDKDSKVWECVNCGHKYIGKDRIEVCPRCSSKSSFVYHKNLVVTK